MGRTEYKNLGGRPLKFESVEKLQDKIEEYYSECKVDKKPLTLEGLAYALDLDIKTIRRYELDENNQFCPTIRKAKSKILANKAERLTDRSTFTPGIIFDLTNNYGDQYKNKQENKNENINDNYNSDITPEQRDARIEELKDRLESLK